MEEEKKEEKKKKITIAHVSVARCETGVEIKAKSKAIEEFIKSHYGDEVATGEANWNRGLKFYKKKNGIQHPTLEAGRHTLTLDGMQRNELVDCNETLNLAFIRLVGLSEGIAVKYQGLFRETEIAGIAQSINEGLRNLFKEYNTPTCYEIEITTEK